MNQTKRSKGNIKLARFKKESTRKKGKSLLEEKKPTRLEVEAGRRVTGANYSRLY